MKDTILVSLLFTGIIVFFLGMPWVFGFLIFDWNASQNWRCELSGWKYNTASGYCIPPQATN